MTHEQLLEKLESLPISGYAWPKAIKTISWILLAVIGLKIIQTASSPAGQQISPTIAISVITLFAALVVIAYYMQTSVLTISAEGISQTWVTERKVLWAEIQSAKFVPLLTSKRLICFTGRGRPIVFNAGTKELQIAFAYIALAYGRKSI